MATPGTPFLSLHSLSKQFGGVKALVPSNLAIGAGERLAIVGHNGAGKSTLVNLLLGVLKPTEGRILLAGQDVSEQHTVRTAFVSGIRCVYQELSLCANLTAYENLGLQHSELRSPGWRSRARALMRRTLDEIFPSNGIDVERPVSELAIGQRQMVEIARAFSVVGPALRLVVLDEPTSSLDSRAAEALLSYLRYISKAGVAIVFISHRLREVLSLVDRVVVMRDGAIVADRPNRDLDKNGLVALMGGEDSRKTEVTPARAPNAAGGQPSYLEVRDAHGGVVSLRAGEIVGLAGLDGQGQREMLQRVFLGQRLAGETIALSAKASYVSGDRHTEGVFPLWSVGRNITVGLVRQLQVFGILRPAAESEVVAKWMSGLKVKAASSNVPILSLSGGNQQKALIARAFASDAKLILLDDPTRGVDVGTKKELYERVQEEADMGRGFLWYTTEVDELEVCDRVYVFYEGRIADQMTREQFTEDRLLRASFEEITTNV